MQPCCCSVVGTYKAYAHALVRPYPATLSSRFQTHSCACLVHQQRGGDPDPLPLICRLQHYAHACLAHQIDGCPEPFVLIGHFQLHLCLYSAHLPAGNSLLARLRGCKLLFQLHAGSMSAGQGSALAPAASSSERLKEFHTATLLAAAAKDQ
eukprot:CAMPEP_0172726094 /NCGR_PEP_ID=MMETSP1074-20121228/89919_1 /TAXON_ID=2916 /ORGANISM="Ceratium fusus, Strain PA161109" /LENGTH=151 /DNA_ID=CAMNT_0013553011 /DNA_START=287 /DNA_END=742 /DNA_ORIENTATION=-